MRAFDPAKHFLGTLCGRGHDDGGGQSYRHIGHDNCVTCSRDSAAAWAKANPVRRQAHDRKHAVKRAAEGYNLRDHHPFAAHAGSAASRARSKGLPTDLSAASLRALWELQGGLCHWTRQPMDFFIGEARHPMRPSLDRLNPPLGYVTGNIVWATNFANRARGDLPAVEFHELMVSFGFSPAESESES